MSTTRSILKIEIGGDIEKDDLSIDAHGTPNMMLGAIARFRIELDKIEHKIKLELVKPPADRGRT